MESLVGDTNRFTCIYLTHPIPVAATAFHRRVETAAASQQDHSVSVLEQQRCYSSGELLGFPDSMEGGYSVTIFGVSLTIGTAIHLHTLP